ncbi:661_t:CDS:2 [Ambispora gerdemannii]|uniref:661_t:CDS:1 n=1 Tax=Ambispora gerdemannii TaxID=144530 RepID=A0A9N8ZAX5_9GLOM|nr:661_t:CDS:2 [Ambispora gerdemannii]
MGYQHGQLLDIPLDENRFNLSVPALAAFGAGASHAALPVISEISLMVQNPAVKERTFNLPSLVALGSGPVIATLLTTYSCLLKVLPLAVRCFPWSWCLSKIA